jgi:hypothetical protein
VASSSRLARTPGLNLTIPDPTRGWRRSHVVAWIALGLVLGISAATYRYSIAYDFSKITSVFQVKDCRDDPSLCVPNP